MSVMNWLYLAAHRNTGREIRVSLPPLLSFTGSDHVGRDVRRQGVSVRYPVDFSLESGSII